MKLQTIFFSVASLLFAPIPSTVHAITPAEAQAIAVDAYIYGYPLVTMEMTRRVMTNVQEPVGMRAPMGQFMHATSYPTAEFKDVTAPNADTLYSSAWLDLSKEPYILSIPDMDGRYHLIPMLSGWTDVFASPGSRTTGTKAQTYAITGPSWQASETSKLPTGITEYKSPSNMVWILARTYCTGTPADYDAVHKLQKEFSLVPLSRYEKPYSAPKGIVNPAIDVHTPVRDQVNDMGVIDYFALLTKLLKDNPPAAEDAPIVAKMAKIGIVPGKEYSVRWADPKTAKALAFAPRMALGKIMNAVQESGVTVNGWTMPAKTGSYGTDYLIRAATAFAGLGANLPEDAIYPNTRIDASGKPLTGENRYVQHFSKDMIPPVSGFWSLTMYGDDYFFVANPLNRYTLSPRNALTYNADGSLDLYIQNESPGADKESNWLPAPKGPFILMMRLYWPKQAVLDGKWTPPAVKMIE
jgi:hypothetical protein